MLLVDYTFGRAAKKTTRKVHENDTNGMSSLKEFQFVLEALLTPMEFVESGLNLIKLLPLDHGVSVKVEGFLALPQRDLSDLHRSIRTRLAVNVHRRIRLSPVFPLMSTLTPFKLSGKSLFLCS